MLAFISHSSRDKAVAREIALFLAAENVGVWFDEWEISAGDSIPREVAAGLRQCTHFLIIWSNNADASPWVSSELEATVASAIQSGEPRIIPVRLDEVELPRLISHLKYLRYGGGTEADRAAVVEAVTGDPPSQDFIRAVVKKYHEVITDSDSDDVWGLRACPNCGGSRLDRTAAVDYAHDELYHFIECLDCGWAASTQ